MFLLQRLQLTSPGLISQALQLLPMKAAAVATADATSCFSRTFSAALCTSTRPVLLAAVLAVRIIIASNPRRHLKPLLIRLRKMEMSSSGESETIAARLS